MTYLRAMEFDDAQQFDETQSDEPIRRSRPRTVYAGRTWAAVLTAFISELVIIGATNNQGMTDMVARKVGAGESFADHLARASQTFHWRFNYHHIAPYSAVGDFIRIGALLVLTMLLMIPVLRGSITFFRAFFGTWIVVVVATVLAQFAGAAPKPNFADPNVEHPATRLFDSYLAPSANGVAAGVGLGLVVGLIAALVAVLSRRTLGTVRPAAPAEADNDDVLPYTPPPPPPPWNPPAADEPPPWTPAPSYQQPAWSQENAETIETSRVDPPEQATTTIEPVDLPAPPAQPEPPAQSDAPTQAEPPTAATTPWPSMPVEEAAHVEDLDADDTVRIDEEEDLPTR